MQTRLFDHDPITGQRELFHFDEVNDTFTIETQHDVEENLEDNKYLINQVDSGWKGDMHRVASIPLVIYFDLKKKGMLNKDPESQKRLRRWLDDPENAHFRTKTGLLSRTNAR